MESMKNVAVIGGGIAGLTAAYRLSKNGYAITLFEKDGALGGLAATFPYREGAIEKYYHFICLPDKPYHDLIDELGLSDKLVWRPTRMAYFVNGKYVPFGTPISLLKFPALPFSSRLRFGLFTLEQKLRKSWEDLDELTAEDWLVRKLGRNAYEVLWKSLLEQKFGDRAAKISAAWMWARINRVANTRRGLLMREYLGYLKGGTQTLIDELAARIRAHGGDIRTNIEVERIVVEKDRVVGIQVGSKTLEFDVVVSTVAPELFVRMCDRLPGDFAARLSEIEYYGVACWTIVAKEALTDVFWLNVSDARISFPGVIEYTNLNPMTELEGLHVLYIPFYMSTQDPRYSLEKEEWLGGILRQLELVKKGFSRQVVDAFLFKDPYAQPVFVAGYSRLFQDLFDPRTPITGLYRIDMSSIYPDDRSIVNAIDKGNLVASIVSASS